MRVLGGVAGPLVAPLLAAPLLAAVAGCGGATGSAGAPTGPASTGPRQLTVLAAASLRTTFTQLADRFEAASPGVRVRLGFAGSSDLVAQLQQGAPADVLATADTAAMQRAADDDLLADEAQAFATNTMAIAVPPGNPAGIRTFADLARPGLAVVICAPQVPCGAATARVEAASGVTLAPVSEEGSVTDVLGKVTAGEADAGVVYATDVAGAGGAVAAVAIPSAVNTTSTYPIAVLAGSRDPGLAGQFRALVLGPEGREVLADAGFGAP